MTGLRQAMGPPRHGPPKLEDLPSRARSRDAHGYGLADRDAGREVGLSGAGRPEEHDVAFLGYEVQGAEVEVPPCCPVPGTAGRTRDRSG